MLYRFYNEDDYIDIASNCYYIIINFRKIFLYRIDIIQDKYFHFYDGERQLCKVKYTKYNNDIVVREVCNCSYEKYQIKNVYYKGIRYKRKK